MTQSTMVILLSEMTGENDETLLLAYLDLAAARVLERCYPFDSSVTQVPARYQNVQVEIAAYLLNKRGAEGETRHNENGVDRTYESASVPESMLRAVVPMAKAVGGG